MKTEERESSFELLRIVAMIMIVLSHATWFGVVKASQPDAYELWQTGSILFKSASSFSVLGTVGVGLFFMITGYFTAPKETTSVKKVFLVTVFYAFINVFVDLVLVAFGVHMYESNGQMLMNLIRVLFIPVSGSVWWFVSAYVLLLIIAPLYNKFLNKLNRIGIIFLISVLLVFGYTLGNLGSNFHDLEKAVFFYTLGYFFRNYSVKNSKGKRIIFVICGLVGILFNGLCQYGVFAFSLQETTKAVLVRKTFSMLGYLIADPVACIGVFGFFNTIRFKNKVVNRIASFTFGVYLFHEAPTIREMLWMYLFKPWNYYGNVLYFVFIPLCVVSVFIIAIIIEILRDFVVFRWINPVISRICDKCKVKFYK